MLPTTSSRNDASMICQGSVSAPCQRVQSHLHSLPNTERHQRYLVVDTNAWIDEAFNLTVRRSNYDNEKGTTDFELNESIFFQGLATTDVKFVLPDQVIHELDGLKDQEETDPAKRESTRKRKRESELRVLTDTAVRARRVIAALRDAQLRSNGRYRFGGNFILAEPKGGKPTVLSSQGKRKGVSKASSRHYSAGMEADRRLINCALNLRRHLKMCVKSSPEDNNYLGGDDQDLPPKLEVVLITSDKNMQLFAGLRGEDREPLKAMTMSEFRHEIAEREAVWQRAYRKEKGKRAIEELKALCMSTPAAKNPKAPNNNDFSFDNGFGFTESAREEQISAIDGILASLPEQVASSTSHDRSGIDDAVGKDDNDGLVIGSTLDASVDNDSPSSMPPNHESNIESDGQHSEETLGPIRHHDSKCSADNSLVGSMTEDINIKVYLKSNFLLSSRKAKAHFDGGTNISRIPIKRLFELLSRRELICSEIPKRYSMEYGKKLVLPQNPSTKKPIKLSDFLCSIEGVQKFGDGPKAWFVATRQTDATPEKVRMAIAAIKALANPKGSSIFQIKQYIEANNMNSVDHNRVCGALEYGVAVGSLSRPEKKKGFYKLAPKNPPKKATPKKVRRIIDVYTRNQVGGRILVAK